VVDAVQDLAEAAAAAIEEAQQALDMLYEAIREARTDGYSFTEIERASGLARGTLQKIIAGDNPPIRPAVTV
jgi:hypothetical protein